MLESTKDIDIEKNPTMIMRSKEPLNLGSPSAQVRKSFITPQSDFFVRNHGSIPQINPTQYTLSVTGGNRATQTFTLDQLRNHFPAATVIATLQCAGHRRDELNAVEEIRDEVQWGAEAIGNAIWRGVLLRDVLTAVGVPDGSQHVAFTGLDEVERTGKRFGFGGSIPVEKALGDDVLLAYEMNGASLSPIHGFPLRVITPGYIGARSVKWLANINIQTHPSSNYFQEFAYKLFPPHIRRENADWSQAEMLGSLPLNSVICSPCEHQEIPAGLSLIQGYAITGDKHKVERVELSIDGGASWITTDLQTSTDPGAWQFWEARLHFAPGDYLLTVRAWDSAGQTQPEKIVDVWNWKGYMNHAWHRVSITVR